MKKLSKTQQRVLNEAKEQIDYARNHTLMEWSAKENHFTSVTRIIEEYAEKYGEAYENEKKGIVLAHCDSKTIRALENLGLIEIMNDGGLGIDTIKVLNY